MKMRSLPQLPSTTSCCGCISLRDGALILGWLGVIGSCLNVISVLRELILISDVDGAIHEIRPECDEDCLANMHKYVLGVGIFSLLLDLTVIGFSALLIYGIYHSRPNFLTPMIVYMRICLVLLVLCFIAGLVVLANIPLGALVFSLLMIVITLLSVHFYMVIVSYRKQMLQALGNASIRLEEEGMPPPPYSVKDY